MQDEDTLDAAKKVSSKTLLCELPCVAVELSRLEVVVLADILSGLSTPTESVSDARCESPCSSDGGNAASSPGRIEVHIEARGATIVLHEAMAFAEEPGPYSFVLNLGDACLHIGGGAGLDQQHHPAPMVTVSSGDIDLHETLRSCGHARPHFPRGQFTGPLLFPSQGDGSSRHSCMEDLPGFGFVSISILVPTQRT